MKRAVGTIVGLVLFLGFGATLAFEPVEESTSQSTFPRIDVLEPNIRFWRDVFSTWGLGQVVVHDTEYPELRYALVQLPGEISETYTEEQQEFVEDLREGWEERLRGLQAKIVSGEQLTDDDKRLALQITTEAGTGAIEEAHRRVRTQRGLGERFRRGLEIGAGYDAALREVFRQAGLPEDLAFLPHVESSFQASARSSAGAVGAWQFTRGTGRRYLKITAAIDERLDPVAAARGAAAYLRNAYDRLGDWALAITSYNHGIEGMLRAKARLGSDFARIYADYRGRTFGFASRNFYAEFLAAREIASDPQRFFPDLQPEPPLSRDWIELERPASPRLLARYYDVPLEQLAELNPAWTRRAIRRGLAVPAGTEVWLPRGTLERIAERGVPAGGVPLEAGYVVQRGDTLSEIAEWHGLTLEQLRTLNGMGPRDNTIHPGQRLFVVDGAGLVTAEPAVHVVRRGESLFKISLSYGVRLTDLLKANRLTRSSIIYPGQQIQIPITQ